MSWDGNQLNTYNRIIRADIDALLRAHSPEYNFLEIRSKVENTINAIQALKENYDFWEQLPKESRNRINSVIEQMITVYEKMDNFNPKQSNAWDERNNIVITFESYYDELYSYLIEKLNAFLGVKAYTKELSSKFGQEAKAELAEFRKYKKEIEKIREDVKSAQTIAGDTASTSTAISFDKQAEEHSATATRWFWGVIYSGILVGLIALLYSLHIIFDWKTFDNIINNGAALTIKIIVLGIALIALRFCIKNYSANRHLYVINKHRANVLKGMEAFRTSAVSDDTKDAVLLAAVSAAFGHMETGMITTKEGAGSSDDISPQLLSIISQLNKKN